MRRVVVGVLVASLLGIGMLYGFFSREGDVPSTENVASEKPENRGPTGRRGSSAESEGENGALFSSESDGGERGEIAAPSEMNARGSGHFLVVIGSDHGQPLNGVEVRETDEECPGTWCHPGRLAGERGLKNEDSPVSLPMDLQSGWVGAPGYSWERFQIDGEGPSGEKGAAQTVITLRPAGSLEVLFSPGELVRDLLLTVMDSVSAPREESHFSPVSEKEEEAPDRAVRERTQVRVGSDSRVVVQGLVPGVYDLVAHSTSGREVIGVCGRVEVLGGGRTSVRVELRHRWAEESVPVQGVLVLPPGRGDDPIDLRFRPLNAALAKPVSLSRDELRVLGGDALRLGWEVGLPPGDCEVALAFSDHSVFPVHTQRISVSESDGNDVWIEVGELAELVVKLVDESGIAIDGGQLGLSCRLSRPQGKFDFRALVVDRQGDLTLLCSPGLVRLYLNHDRYEWSTSEDARRAAKLRLTPGRNEVEFRLRRKSVQGVEFRLMAKGDPVRMKLGYWELVSLEGPDDPPYGNRVREMTGDGVIVYVLSPGRYRATFPPIEGYGEIPDRLVEVQEDAVTEVEVEVSTR